MLALSLAATLLFALPTTTEGNWSPPRQHVSGRAIVKLHGIDARALPLSTRNQDALKELAARSGVSLSLIRPVLLGWGLFEIRAVDAPAKSIPDEHETLSLIERLARDAGVDGAVPDRWYRRLSVPSDPGYAQQWDLPSMGMPQAWDLTTGTAEQRIGVVDTGTIRNHEDLQGKDLGGYDFIDDRNEAADGNGRDADYNDPGDGADCGQGYEESSFHGTHVAGTILASTNNGAGIAGINWNAKLMTARALGRCGGALSDIMDGAAWLAGYPVDGVPSIGNNKVKVMNLSLGSSGQCSSYEQQVIDVINQQGAIFVAATGNDGGPVGSPANCSGAVAVAAHGPGTGRALTEYSSFGSSVAIVAPGGEMSQRESNGILSSVGPGSTDYAYYEGTSMASPHVTGVISLVQALDPSLTRAQIVSLMQQTGAACSGCNGKKALQAGALLAAVTPAGGSTTSSSSGGGGTTSSGGSTTLDPTEPNDTFASGTAITCGTTIQSSLGTNDLDWFRVAPSTGAHLVVSLRGPAGQDFDLYVTTGASNDAIVARSEGETADESIDYVSAGGTLGVVVIPYQGAQGDYTLTANCEGGGTPGLPADDGDEPNDSAQDATSIACNTSIDGVSLPGNADWFTLSAVDGTTVNAVLESDLEALNLMASNASGGGNVMAQSAGNRKTLSVVLAGGRAFLTVLPSSSGASSYHLAVTCSAPGDTGDTPVTGDTGGGDNTGGTPPAEDDSLEPNNSLDVATRLSCGSSSDLVAFDVDVYKVRVSDGEDLVIEVNASFSGMQVTLLNRDGDVLQESTGSAGDGIAVRGTSLSSGSYFVKLDPGASGGGTYTIDIGCKDHEEPASVGGCSQSGGSPWSIVVVALVMLAMRRRRV